MNNNIVVYSIYLPLVSFIMIKIGWLFYKHGEIFLLYIFNHNTNLVKSINTILLVGYYLVNLGYAIITIAYWESIETLNDAVSSITHTLGKIIIILALLHYNNVFWLTFITKSKILKQ